MSNVQAKRRDNQHGGKNTPAKKIDVILFIAAIITVALVLVFVPKFFGMLGVSFLATGSGLNKLLSVIVAVVLGWLCLLPVQSYKNFISLAKGARIEWRKTIKPDRDTVMRTTMMVLALVILFALMILVLDWVFGSVLRVFVN